MSDDFVRYTARRPRYEATVLPPRLEVRRSAEKQPQSIAAELVDFSRGGFRLRLEFPLEAEEVVRVEFPPALTGSPLGLTAAVCWQRVEQSGSWLIGCKAQSEVNWETLGELFLRGVLRGE
jgi:hypothetical protein